MRDQFPNNQRLQHLSQQDINRLLAAVQSSSFSVPGATMGGLRSASFGADLPQAKTILVRAYALNVVPDSTVPCGIDMPPVLEGAFPSPSIEDDPVRVFNQTAGGFYDPTTYFCNYKSFSVDGLVTDYNGDAVDGSTHPHLSLAFVDTQDLLKVMQCNWLRGSFFLPTYYEDVSVTAAEADLAPEEFTAVYDYIAGRFSPITAITLRSAYAIADQSEDSVDAQVLAGTVGGDRVATNTFIRGVKIIEFGTEFDIRRGDELLLALLNGLWFVLKAEDNSLAHDIEFRLIDKMSMYDSLVRAEVMSFANGKTPGETIRVRNPRRGNTTLGRFWGESGMGGSAVYLTEDMEYKIIQMDCENIDDAPEDSGSSVSELSSSSSTSSLSSSSSTCSEEEASSSTS